MTKTFIQEQKNKLNEKKRKIENELKSFAKKDPNIKGNWKTKFPFFGPRTPDPAEEQDQIEEYEANLPIEYTLETELQKIEKALKRIKKNKYGTCEKCKKKISAKRLKSYPEVDICIACAKPKTG